MNNLTQEQFVYKPKYTISPNGVGYMPSKEIAKTKQFRTQLAACGRLQEKANNG